MLRQQSPNTTQVTFHYTDTQAETFNVPISPDQFYQQLDAAASQNWLVLHLFDQSITIRMQHLVKVEIKPAIAELTGQGVFPNAERMTALKRGAMR
ncbi:hypothetical protein [Geitlerinema sp. PCC 9228]|jgi:hypothetical protein|uniref:hypothetical protein n=1 Tax=Geitlerinema sp. PCC 9228 TaxID=111611 RepID=UPI0008F9CF46|nr:hypothetical protein [Geitlerinema sp. PCC 9228]